MNAQKTFFSFTTPESTVIHPHCTPTSGTQQGQLIFGMAVHVAPRDTHAMYVAVTGKIGTVNCNSNRGLAQHMISPQCESDYIEHPESYSIIGNKLSAIWFIRWRFT